MTGEAMTWTDKDLRNLTSSGVSGLCPACDCSRRTGQRATECSACRSVTVTAAMCLRAADEIVRLKRRVVKLKAELEEASHDTVAYTVGRSKGRDEGISEERERAAAYVEAVGPTLFDPPTKGCIAASAVLARDIRNGEQEKTAIDAIERGEREG